MHFPRHNNPPPLHDDPHGVIRVTGTRIPLERVIHSFLAGDTPEQIVQDYDTLTIQQVYSIVDSYLHNRDEVDAYLAQSEQEEAVVQEKIEAQYDSVGIRARLLSRKR